MKTLITLAFIAPFLLSAQSAKKHITPYSFMINTGDNYSNPLKFDHTLLKSVKGKAISEVTKTTELKGGKKVYSTSYKLNDFGKPIEVKSENYQATVEYYNDTLLGKITQQSKKEITYDYSYVNGNLVRQETFVEDRLKTRTINQYNVDGNVTYSSVNSPNRKRNYSMLYSYQGEDLMEQRYMKNDRIIRVWNYSCKPEGEAVVSKNQSNVCHYQEENNDGSYISYAREEIDGNVYLKKHYFTSDSTFYKGELFLNETHLISLNELDGDISKYTKFDKKGKIIHSMKTTINDKKQVLKREVMWGGKEKRVSSSEYAFNEDGTIAQEIHTYKQKVNRVIKYDYTK